MLGIGGILGLFGGLLLGEALVVFVEDLLGALVDLLDDGGDECALDGRGAALVGGLQDEDDAVKDGVGLGAGCLGRGQLFVVGPGGGACLVDLAKVGVGRL